MFLDLGDVLRQWSGPTPGIAANAVFQVLVHGCLLDASFGPASLSNFRFAGDPAYRSAVLLVSALTHRLIAHEFSEKRSVLESLVSLMNDPCDKTCYE